MERPTKITFAEMREMGMRGLLVCCADSRSSHSIAISGDGWPDDVRLSDIEAGFVCTACGKRGADVRPDFNWNRQPIRQMGYLRGPAKRPTTEAALSQFRRAGN